MRRTIAMFLLSFLVHATTHADPIVVQQLDDPNTPADEGVSLPEMATALFAGTPGITVADFDYTGAPQASGLFSGAGDVIGIEQGILLTSGQVTNVVGPNNQPAATSNNGQPGDPMLDGLISGFTTFDASVLDITIVPAGQTLSFSYVFGSEEYNEFVGSNFNDVFGFFVNGENFAVIPGTDTPVSINNVNNGVAGAGPCMNCAFYIDNAQGGTNTQLDGFTTVLSFTAPVMPGVENTLKLGVADAGDDSLDSAVFIEGGSISSPGGSPDNPILPVLENPDGFDFNFFVTDPTTTIFIDPLVAIGYDFIVNSGPLFASVTLPDVGDGLFDIFDELGNLLVGGLAAGVQFFFPGPLDFFKVLGIETSAGLDPLDPLAFVTGLTFDSVGQVDMSMNPISVTVPEPATFLLLGGGVALVLRRRRRQARRIHPLTSRR